MLLFPLCVKYLAILYPSSCRPRLEVKKQRHYFIFLYVQLFLVVSISSSVTTMIPEIIRRIDSVPAMLARNLPKAADYFYSYLAIQTVTHCVTILFRLPESMWLCLARRRECAACKPIDWSLVYPIFANMMSICLIFSVISPLILPVGLIMFTVFLITYSYQVIYVAEPNIQGNGLLYWEALHHVFVGIYTMNIFLLGLFFLRKAFGPAIVATALLFGVGLTQFHVQQRIRPLMRFPTKQ
ncbi:hypothetical protein BJY01DRAFT_234338 [Aspergillus pseudoustus]|uniref:CSC1/OSCA1-like 7TM region domain-containing protein n=1 Tax=Aspergillus pseudoustus TaxID=1810923 RepID=A0ABR4K4K6_9EURO